MLRRRSEPPAATCSGEKPWKPGIKRRGEGGCLVVFALPFILTGLSAVASGLAGKANRQFGHPWDMLVLVACGLLFAIAGSGVLIRGLRLRRKAAAVPEGVRNWEQNPVFPKSPAKSKQGNYGVRLDARSSTLGGFVAITIFALIWNGIVFGIGFSQFKDGVKGSEWGLIIFLSIFGLVGIAVIAFAIHMFLKMILTGDSAIEIGADPMPPGSHSRLFVFQKGGYAITSATVTLICRESASYRQGTDTITRTEDVYTQVLTEQSNLQARGHEPLLRTEFQLPANAMHSFAGSNNRIEWIIKVKLDIPGRPDVNEDFHFRVAPRHQ